MEDNAIDYKKIKWVSWINVENDDGKKTYEELLISNNPSVPETIGTYVFVAETEETVYSAAIKIG